MTDQEIIALFKDRNEKAIEEATKKYQNCCFSISKNILQNDSDAEECVNDAYFRTWNTIPPNEPENLSTYIGKIVRNISIDYYRKKNARKRPQSEVIVAMEELEDCVYMEPKMSFEDRNIILECLNEFLKQSKKEDRIIFVRRYWYTDSISDIASAMHVSESKIKSVLFRMRKKLQIRLVNEGCLNEE